MEETNKKVVMLVVVAVVAFGLGVLVGTQYGGGTSSSSTEVAKLQAQIEKAKQFFPTMPDVRSLTGTVTAVNSNVVTMSVTGNMNPFDDSPTVREVVVTDATVIETQSAKDPAVFQKEVAAYQAEVAKAAGKGTAPAAIGTPPPSPFETKKIAVGDLQEKDAITVTAAENIKTAARFNAASIRVQAAAAPGAAGTPAGAPPISAPATTPPAAVPPGPVR